MTERLADDVITDKHPEPDSSFRLENSCELLIIFGKIQHFPTLIMACYLVSANSILLNAMYNVHLHY